MRELRNRDPKTNWQLLSGTRLEVLDGEIVAALYETGCQLITYAPDGGSDKTFQEIKELKLPPMKSEFD